MKGLAKLVCLALLLLCIIPNAFSQSKLWGTLLNSGKTESGAVYEVNLDGSAYEVIKEFNLPHCEGPRGKLLYASNDKIYGIAEGGFGSFGSVIYEYDPVNGSFEFAHDFFDTETGQNEMAHLTNLIEHSNGKVYGLTQYGGDHYDGQLFEFDLQTKTISIKVHFEAATKGEIPLGGLTEATDGRLYGVTREGGAHSFGVLYVYDPASNIFAVLKHFDGVGIGSAPNDGPIQASNGKLYGLTRTGGTSDMGVVYEYDIAANHITKKHDFDGAGTGSGPEGKFCQASNGLLYAMTGSGGTADQGAIIDFDISTSLVTKKRDLGGTNGRYPVGEFVEYTDGWLYALASNGGIDNKGVLFKYDPVSSNFTKLYDLYEEYGEYAYGSLTIGPEGKLFGVTTKGGLHANKGVLFDYNPSSALYTVRLEFRYSDIGGLPECSLITASDGMVYGTNGTGGDDNAGIIFRIDPTDRSFEKVFDFEFSNLGGGCKEGLTEAANGMLYGLASYGGSNFYGTLFVFDPLTSNYTVLFHFDETSSGGRPVGKVVQGSNGSLYGLTEYGGANGDGVLFEYILNSSTFLKLHDFDVNTSGRKPTGLMQAANGKLYGLSSWGGSFNNGVLFEYDPSTYNMDVKVNFDGINKGAYPVGTILEYEDNQLYGMTGHGGSESSGVLFHFDATNGQYAKVLNFLQTGMGFSPFSSLMKSSNDLVYGTTSHGGLYMSGTVFSFSPDDSEYNTIYDFLSYRDKPFYGALLEIETDFGIDDNYDNQTDLFLYPNPVEDVLNISVDQWDNKQVNIKVINQLGQLMHETQISIASSTIELDVESVETGIYFIHLTDESGHSGIGKFVKTE